MQAIDRDKGKKGKKGKGKKKGGKKKGGKKGKKMKDLTPDRFRFRLLVSFLSKILLLIQNVLYRL